MDEATQAVAMQAVVQHPADSTPTSSTASNGLPRNKAKWGIQAGSESSPPPAATVAVSPGASDEHRLRLPPPHSLNGAGSRSNDHSSIPSSANAAPDGVLEKLAYLEERCEAKDVALAQSERQSALLTQLLRSAKSSIECLGEEADSEVHELQVELHSKQESLNNARSELESMATMAVGDRIQLPVAARGPDPAELAGCDGLLDADIDGLRRVLAEKEAVCAALRSEVHTADIQSNAVGLDPQILFQQRGGTDASLHKQLGHWESRCGSLEAEAGMLRAEALDLMESEQMSWQQYSRMHGDITSDFARLRYNVEESKLQWAECERKEATRMAVREERMREETEVLVAGYGRREREAEHHYAEEAAFIMASEAFQEEQARCKFVDMCAAFTSELNAAAAAHQRAEAVHAEAVQAADLTCNEKVQEQCGFLESRLRETEEACRVATNDEQRLANKCAADAREMGDVKILVQRLADKCASGERRLGEAELEEQRLAERCSALQQGLRDGSTLSSPGSASRRGDALDSSWGSWMGGFTSRRQESPRVQYVAPQQVSDDRWQRFFVRILQRCMVEERKKLRDAWATGSNKWKVHVESLNEQRAAVAQDMEKYCEAGERRLMSMEESCMTRIGQSATAAQFVGAELKEAQLAWTARHKVMCKELQEEQASRQAAEDGLKQAEQLAGRLREDVTAHMDRSDAIVNQLGVVLRDEESEVARLRHSLDDAEHTIGMMVAHGHLP